MYMDKRGMFNDPQMLPNRSLCAQCTVRKNKPNIAVHSRYRFMQGHARTSGSRSK